MKRICETCKWYDPISETTIRFGECHYFPPTVSPSGIDITPTTDPESGETLQRHDYPIERDYPHPHTWAKSRCAFHSYNPLRNLKRRIKQAWKILKGA